MKGFPLIAQLGRSLAQLREYVSYRIFGPYRIAEVEAVLPKPLAKRVVYVVSEDGFEEQAAMICPCGCRQILHMNLLPDERPRWDVTRHEDGTASLHPSVWRQKGCRSHFWLRNGRVRWC